MRWLVVACASVALAAENATCDRPTLVWLPSSPYSGSHLSRRLLEAALGLCTYAINPEGVATPLFGGKVLDSFIVGSLSASADNARYRAARGWEPCATPDCASLSRARVSLVRRAAQASSS